MKKTFLFIFAFSAISFSQSKQAENILPDLNKLTIKDSFNFKPIRFKTETPFTFYTYNKHLNTQTHYLITKTDYSLNNLYHVNNLSIMNNTRTDSFNPTGTNNIETALIFGVLNYIFK